MTTLQLQGHKPGLFSSGAPRRALPSSCFSFLRRARASVSWQGTSNVLPDGTYMLPARTHPRFGLAATTASDAAALEDELYNRVAEEANNFKVKLTLGYTVSGVCCLEVTETLDPTSQDDGGRATNAAMLAVMSSLEHQRRRALARAINYVAERHPEALDFAAIFGRLSEPLAAGDRLDESKPPQDLMKAVRFEELYSLCQLLEPRMCGTVDYEILDKLGQMERKAREILEKRQKEAEGAAALAAADRALSSAEVADSSGAEAGSGSTEAAASSGAETSSSSAAVAGSGSTEAAASSGAEAAGSGSAEAAGSGNAEAAGSGNGSSEEPSSSGESSGSSSTGSGGAAGASPADAAASPAAGGEGRPREAAAGSSSAPAEGDTPLEYTPETAAQRMSYESMAVWKRALRTAIYGWARMQPEPLDEPKPRFTFTLTGITPDELPMTNSVVVELDGSGSKVFSTLMERLYVSIGLEKTKEVVDYWKNLWGGVGGIECVEGPEEVMLQGLLNRALLTVCLPKGGETFECTFFTDAEPQPAAGGSSSAGSSGKASELCSFSGTRKELVVVCLGLAMLEGDLDYAKEHPGWFPSHSRIAFQRQGVPGRDARYRLRVQAAVQPPGEQKEIEVDAMLSSKQLWALADCLDGFFAAHPHAMPRKKKKEG